MQEQSKNMYESCPSKLVTGTELVQESHAKGIFGCLSQRSGIGMKRDYKIRLTSMLE